MKPLTLWIPSIALLCLGGAWAGRTLGLADAKPSPSSASNESPGTRKIHTPVPVAQRGRSILPADVEAMAEQLELGKRRILRGASTDSLWDLLNNPRARNGIDPDMIADELLDRLGKEALNIVFKDSDASGTGDALRYQLLSRYALRDHGGALEMYEDYRSRCGRDWGYNAATMLVSAACGISTDRLIATWAITVKEQGFPSTLPSEYPSGFDYVRGLACVQNGLVTIPSCAKTMMKAFARDSPEAAARWLMNGPARAGMETTTFEPAVSQEIRSLAESRSAEKNTLLSDLSQAFPDMIRTTWHKISNENPEPTANLLEAATAMGMRQEYLENCMQRSEFPTSQGNGWASVPAEEREALLEASDAAWAAKPGGHTELEEKAHSTRRDQLLKSWSASGHP